MRAPVRPSEEGFTLVETLMTMLLLSMVLASVVTATVAVHRNLGVVTNNRVGLGDVQTVQERLSRDLRQARGIDTGATSSQLRIWIDENSDYVKTADEVNVWRVVDSPGGGGTKKQIERVNEQSGIAQIIGRTLVSNAVFSYNTADVTQATVLTVRIDYNARVRNQTKVRHVEFAIKLRNVG